MLGTTRNGLTHWLGAGSALLAVALMGCGGHSSGSKKSSSSATAATTSNTTTAPTTTSTTTAPTTTATLPPVVQPPVGVIDDHGNDAASATALVGMAQPMAGEINYAADADWFKVTLSAGVNYDFLTVGLAAGMDTILRLVDSNGTGLLAENDNVTANDPSSRLNYAITADGDYYLAVFHADPAADVGTYSINYLIGTPPPAPDDHGNDMANATVLTVGTPINGHIEINVDEDWFVVTMTAGQRIDMRTNVADPTVDDTTIDVYDAASFAAGQTLADNDDIAYPNEVNSAIDGFAAPADGDYYVVVGAFVPGGGGGVTPRYELAVVDAGVVTPPPADDHGNDMANATPLTVGTPINGHIEVNVDEDWFVVTLAAGDSIDMRTNVGDPTVDDTTLEIYDAASFAAGAVLDENDDIAYPAEINSAIDAFIAPADGDYYVVVGAFVPGAGGGVTPRYELAVITTGGGTTPPPVVDDHGNDYTTATPVTAGALGALVPPTAGKVEVAGDEDWFSVDLTANTDYDLYTVTQDDTTLTLYDVDGTTLLVFNDNDPNAQPGENHSRIAYTAPATGTYFMAVAGATPPGGAGTTPDYAFGADDVTVAPPVVGANLTGSTFNDLDGSNSASVGDEIVLQFSEAVTMILPAVMPPPVIDSDTQCTLPVAGDTFGAGSAIVAGPGANEFTITLGSDPVIRLSGTFDMANVTDGSASGIDVTANNTISTASNGAVAIAGVVDLDSTLVAGFSARADLNEARGYTTATVLQDGRVLITGGVLDAGQFAYSNEIFDAGVWTDTEDPTLGGPGGAMAALGTNGNVYYIGRYDHTSTLLPSGQVLIAGGVGFEGLFDAAGNPVIAEMQSAFLFDPTTNEFVPTASPLNIPRRGHTATVMPNGQVLLTGGYNSNTYQLGGGTLPFVEVFDPATGVFTNNANDLAIPREGSSVHVLPNGDALLVGGYLYAPNQAGTAIALYVAPDSEVYSMTTGGTAGPAMVTSRRWLAGAESNGSIYALGGRGFVNGVIGMLDTVEKFDPAAGGDFVEVGTLSAPRGRHTAHAVGNNILVIGGMQYDGATGVVTNMTTGELYNTTANVVETYNMVSDRNSHAAVTLQDGSILVIGGWAGGTTSTRGFDGTAVIQCEGFSIP